MVFGQMHLRVGLVGLFVAANLLCYAGRMPLFHEEPRCAIIAQEMLLTGDYVVPKVYQTPYLKKPPMQNWLIALVSLPAGRVTELTARAVYGPTPGRARSESRSGGTRPP